MLKYAAALALTLAAVPAFAQVGATQSPPAPNAGSVAPQPVDSVPPGSLTSGPAQSPNVGPVVGAGGTSPMTAPSPGAAMSTTVPVAPR